MHISRLLNRNDTGRGVRGDLDALAYLCRVPPRGGRCGLIDGAVTVVESSFRTFPDEYEAQLLGAGAALSPAPARADDQSLQRSTKLSTTDVEP